MKSRDREVQSRIKILAPLISSLGTFLFERSFFPGNWPIIGITWVLSLIFLTFGIYFYQKIITTCPYCKENWTYHRYKRLMKNSLRKKILSTIIVKISRVLDLYLCDNCSYKGSKRARIFSLESVRKAS